MREQDQQRRSFADFTEEGYRRVLKLAKANYAFEPFGTTSSSRHVLWRHDIDMSVHRALRMAQIEAEEGVRATYFFYLRSEFYNLLEKEVTDRARQIASLGHWAGLHFYASGHGAYEAVEELEARIFLEKSIVEDVLSAKLQAISFHDPDAALLEAVSIDRMAGLINAYGAAVRGNYEYCSDSNGYWRHKRLGDILQDTRPDRLHVLTHPEWWVPDAMSPRDRVMRCIKGRAEGVYSDYEQALERSGRVNVGTDV